MPEVCRYCPCTTLSFQSDGHWLPGSRRRRPMFSNKKCQQNVDVVNPRCAECDWNICLHLAYIYGPYMEHLGIIFSGDCWMYPTNVPLWEIPIKTLYTKNPKVEHNKYHGYTYVMGNTHPCPLIFHPPNLVIVK